MNRLFYLILFLLVGCAAEPETKEEIINHFTREDYSKKEVTIEMRDGIKLFTTIYSPKDTTQEYPVIIKRTPYSCRPYGPDTIPAAFTHNPHLVESGYHFVVQDVRGRWMSEGDWENVKPPYSFWDSTATDEVTDSWDTYDWLVENLDHFNGNIGQYGNSYPGWTSLIGAVSDHPNLKAVMAMAPVTNFYYEDFSRYGIFAMNYIPVINFFGTATPGPTQEQWWNDRDSIFYVDLENEITVPYYEFFRDRISLTQYDDILDSTNSFWENIRNHPNYDDYHEKRNWLNYLDRINTNIMIVGGFNDEQNLFGILNSYKTISQTNENVKLCVGPWTHGHNKLRDSLYYMGNVFYGENISIDFQKDVEFAYFEYHLKGRGEEPSFKVRLFDTGAKKWAEFAEFPVTNTEEWTYYPNPEGKLLAHKYVTSQSDYTESYISDPKNPVPYLEDNDFHRMAPKNYFTDDQRFLEGRPDVLSWETDPLSEDLTVLGEIQAILQFASDHQDADLYVKVIDIYPEDREPEPNDLEGVNYKGYEQLVRVGYIRGRFRNGFKTPEPMTPNEKTEIRVPLLEIYHTFKKGHKLKIMIQSSMFPLFGMNPQKYVENIYFARPADFEKAHHKIFHDTRFILPVLKQ